MGRLLKFSDLEYKEHSKKHLGALHIHQLFGPCLLPCNMGTGTSHAAGLLYLAMTLALPRCLLLNEFNFPFLSISLNSKFPLNLPSVYSIKQLFLVKQNIKGK